MNDVTLNEDILSFVSSYKDCDLISNSSFLITGSTGLIGSVVTRCLLGLNEKFQLNLLVICPVRNFNKARLNINDSSSSLKYISMDEMTDIQNVDFIVHCAAPTNSSDFVNKSIETIDGIVTLTRSILEIADKIKVRSMVYLSSLEVYGQVLDDAIPVTEDIQGYINPLNSRSSYSLGKRMAEMLCYCFSKERNVQVKIARLTQTFGPGVYENDNRVFAQFAKSAILNENIELSTEGKSAKPYCYTIDAVNAILTILLKGQNGEAYNVANEDSYISIKNMADLVIENFNPSIKVNIKLDPTKGYAPDTKLRLSCHKLKALGWIPNYDLITMFDRLIQYIK